MRYESSKTIDRDDSLIDDNVCLISSLSAIRLPLAVAKAVTVFAGDFDIFAVVCPLAVSLFAHVKKKSVEIARARACCRIRTVAHDAL